MLLKGAFIMKTEKIFHPETRKTALNPRIADIAHRLNTIDFGSNELAALEWLAGNPDEFGDILRKVYRYCV